VTTLPRTVSQAQLVEEIKKASSKWIKALDTRYRGFFWQRGYGAFSVSPSQLDAVLQYVDTQQEHHRTRSFQEEYRELLRRHGLDFDERYIWHSKPLAGLKRAFGAWLLGRHDSWGVALGSRLMLRLWRGTPAKEFPRLTCCNTVLTFCLRA
jgi:hypothetical protein